MTKEEIDKLTKEAWEKIYGKGIDYHNVPDRQECFEKGFLEGYKQALKITDDDIVVS